MQYFTGLVKEWEGFKHLMLGVGANSNAELKST